MVVDAHVTASEPELVSVVELAHAVVEVVIVCTGPVLVTVSREVDNEDDVIVVVEYNVEVGTTTHDMAPLWKVNEKGVQTQSEVKQREPRRKFGLGAVKTHSLQPAGRRSQTSRGAPAGT